MYKEFSISILEILNTTLLSHLIREDGQEDLCFALYAPSYGLDRQSALVNEVILPEVHDRQIHGNVSFNEIYFKRVCLHAMSKGMGVCFIHSHPYPGWQSMSQDDIDAETKIAPTSSCLTNFPLIGLTVGSDGTWSGRIWEFSNKGEPTMTWASLVKSVGSSVMPSFNDRLLPPSEYREQFKRTRTVYGDDSHKRVTRLRIGIVGLGSVGSILAEMLARMGFQRFTLIDFDVIKAHNLDRQLGSTEDDIGKDKVVVAERVIRKSATSKNLEIKSVIDSIAYKSAYKTALDCDVLFSCVDRPLPRYILNHIAYAHLIPVIDGGIKVAFKDRVFQTAEWQLQTCTSGKACLQCLGVYQPSEVDLERSGKLDDPTYMEGLPNDHHLKSNENIFPFSANLASMEIFQLIALLTKVGDAEFGVQRFRYVHGMISNYGKNACVEHCPFVLNTAMGDLFFTPV
jgi:molybdopterin-synthase adenylyltransferase